MCICGAGTDRAYRRYWVHQRVAGLFVESGAEPRGPCRLKPLPTPPPARSPTDTLAYVAELYETELERGMSLSLCLRRYCELETVPSLVDPAATERCTTLNLTMLIISDKNC